MSFLEILSGNSHRDLADAVATELRQKCDQPECTVVSKVGRYADGEVSVEVQRNLRNRDVFIIQPMCRWANGSVNDALAELLLLINASVLASAKSITVIMSYMGYARQDRKTKPRTPISAAAMAGIIAAVKPTRIVTVDLHCGQIQGFYQNIPVDNLYAENLIAEWVRGRGFPLPGNVSIVSPDAGGVVRARRLSSLLGGLPIVTVIKQRSGPNQIESVQVIGETKDRMCIILDDMIDTAGTVCAAALQLKNGGAHTVVVAATHGLFSGPAYDRLRKSVIDEVVVTNTVPQVPYPHSVPTITVLDVAPLLGEAVCRLHNGESLSALFQN